MRITTILFLFLALIAGFITGRLSVPDTQLPTPDSRSSYPLIRAVDGDTIRISYQPPGAINTRIRLLDIDCPEPRDPGGPEAAAELTRLLAGQPVTLQFSTPGRPSYDRYGRLLARVITSSGLDTTASLITSGHCFPYP